MWLRFFCVNTSVKYICVGICKDKLVTIITKQSPVGYVTVSSICVMKHNYSDHIKGDETDGAFSIHMETCKENIDFWRCRCRSDHNK